MPYTECRPKPEMPEGFTASELMGMDFPEPIWIVQGLIPEGFTVLAGKPKLGKSLLGLGLGIAVASGGKALGQIDVERGRVLYLALEDGPRRLKKRLASCLCGGRAPEELHIHTAWPKLDKGGLDLLREWIEKHPDTRLIILDTLAKLWPKPTGKGNGETLYTRDYDIISSVKAISDQHNIGIIAVHHLRKAVADDPVEQISGSMGISGSADTILLLDRARGKADAKLTCTGRDIEEQELALRFDKVITSWCLLGDAADYARSQEQVEIIELLKDAPEPMQLKDILQMLGKQKRNVNKLLNSLEKDGIIIRAARGKYTLSQKTLISSSLSSLSTHSSLGSPSSPSSNDSADAHNREPKGNLGEHPPVPFFSEDSCGSTIEGNKGNYVHSKVKCCDCSNLLDEPPKRCEAGHILPGISILHQCEHHQTREALQ